MKKRFLKSTVCMLLTVLLLWEIPQPVSAKNASGAAAFDHLTWEKILEKNVTSKNGVVQAICATDQYIICLENSGDKSKENDIAYAYYKNDVDENGIPVEQYSLAFTNSSWDWEHCNGMCYNADTDEIYVALYTSNDPESRGCVYVMDPHTLDFKRSIKIADHYNILGIGYYPKKGLYMIQANAEGEYAIKILDGNFEKIADFGAGDLGLGTNSQDMCVCGDYIMNFPLTFEQEGLGSYMNVYSIDFGTENDPDDYPIQFKLMKEVEMDLETSSTRKVEPESICEVEDGVFIVTVNIMTSSGKRKYAWYKTELGGYSYEIKTSCSNGTISASEEILRGGSYKVTYKPNEGYQLSSVTVDGVPVDTQEYPASYTFTDITEDHKISVEYAEKTVLPEVQKTDEADTRPTENRTVKHSTDWKWILVVLPVLLALFLLIRRIRQYLRIERRKKYLHRRIRREKERMAAREAVKEEEGIAEDTDIGTLLREIDEIEHRKR